MAVTPTYSFRYPVGSDDVDIPSDIYNLAADVESVLTGQFLKLSGGTLTGSLSGTSLSLSSTLSVAGTTTFTGDLTISKASATHTINSTSGTTNVNLDSVAGTYKYLNFRTGTSARWTLGTTATAESGSNAGTDLFIGRSSDGGAYIDAPLTITRSTGAITLTGNLTINKASPSMVITGSGLSQLQITSTASNYAQIELSRAAGQWGATFVRSGSALRWGYGVNGDAESGANAGSNFVFYSYSDAGSYLGNPLTITRSTGAVTLTGNVLIEKASPILKIDSTSGHAALDIERPAGSHGYIYFKTAGYGYRWIVAANGTTESGSNAGSDFTIARYSDAAAFIDTPLTITRSTGAVTLTGTLNGKVVNDLVTGPASATDNALVRFDNTTGKVVQNSGITVDDSGNVTSDLTISKATAQLKVTATSAAPLLSVRGNAGQERTIDLRTDTSRRWRIIADNTAESGSNVGSDFAIQSYDDSSAFIANVIYGKRSTGTVTLGSVGATAGLELGSSGPRIMSGTGSPEGVVTAPVGSTWTDTAATTGAIKWIKATGTGNTGWVVQYGDTGLRNLSAETLLNGWTIYASEFNLRRVGNMVEVNLWPDKTSASADSVYTIPSGFRPAVAYARFTQATNVGDDYCRGYIMSTGDFRVLRSTMTGAIPYIYLTYVTSDPWPSTLPGT